MIKLKDILNNFLYEEITLPVKVGDTVLMGRFKNKKVVVKTIGKDEHGMPTINGKKVVTFRIPKTVKETILKEGKTVSIFDFDDTLAKTDSWVYVKNADGMEKQLDPAEFAVYSPKKGEEFDFRDFDRKLRNPRIIKKNVDLLKKQLSKGGRKVTILTARRLGVPINHFFKTLGIRPYVVPLGDANPQKKAEYIESEIKKGYTTVYFMDDSPKNIRAVDSLKIKYPGVRIVTKLVK